MICSRWWVGTWPSPAGPLLDPGKCSHGGHFDQSSSQPPRGGINKDSTSPSFSPHHELHLQAGEVALLASIDAFSLLRHRLGDKGFSRWVAVPGAQGTAPGGRSAEPHRVPALGPRLLDITPASSLSFVLDTTGSMGEEINAAKIQAQHIVEQRRGSAMEPSSYVLVPFHDPGRDGGGKRAQGEREATSDRGPCSLLS